MEIDPIATLSLAALNIAVFAWIYYRKPLIEPHLCFSSLRGLKQTPPTWKIKGKWLPQGCLWLACACLGVAFVDPHIYLPYIPTSENKTSPVSPPNNRPPPSAGAAIYLVLDQSGSMEEKATFTQVAEGKSVQIQKFSLLKSIAKGFIEERPDDLIGMISFARIAQVLSPLTLDHKTLLKLLDNLDIMRLPDQDGTGIGYAIFKTASIIVATRHFAKSRAKEGKPPYNIQEANIILITDGEQDTNPLDAGSRWRTMSVEEAAKYAAQHGIRVYVINVEPKLASEQFAPQRRQVEKATKLTGGDLFQANPNSGPEQLQKIHQEINRIKKSTQLPGTAANGTSTNKVASHTNDRKSDKKGSPSLMRVGYEVPWLMFALCCIIFALALDALWLKKVP